MTAVDKFWLFFRQRGASWTVLYVGRTLLLRWARRLDRWLIGIEKRKFLTGHGTISSRSHTVGENRAMWNDYDWAESGEEWTRAAQIERGLDPQRWKASLIDNMMFKYIRRDATVLEIGAGAGRWGEVLAPVCRHLILADISQKCLSLCHRRFSTYPNVEYFLIADDGLGRIPQETVDYIWSYDSFVHINPTDADRYLADFYRILKPGAYALIHHAGSYQSEDDAVRLFRSHLDAAFFAHLARKHGLDVIEQNTSLPHVRGDVISVIRKPDA
jgi:SAM-dependent methyltransferase